MRKIEIEIPEGKKAEWVNGILTLVDEPKKHHEFKVGDKAILTREVAFMQGFGGRLIAAGAEVEITNVWNSCSGDLYEIKFQNAMSVVYGCDLDPIMSEQEVNFKFKVGDKVTFINGTEPYTITDRFIAGKDCPACIYELDDCENVEEDKIELYVPKDTTDRIKTFEDGVEWCATNGKKEMTEFYGFIHNNLSNMEGEIDEEDKDIIPYLKLRIITAALNEGWEPTFEDDGYIGYYDKRCRAFRCCTYGKPI